jgi:hypothetical protein
MTRVRVKVIHLMAAILVLALMLPLIAKVARVRTETHEMNCRGTLSFLNAHLLDYRDRFGHFPPTNILDSAGRPMHSWRAVLYAEIDPKFRLAYNFAEPWNSPSNIRLADRPPNCFTCGNNQAEPARYTNYVALDDSESYNLRKTSQGERKRIPAGGIVVVEYPDSSIWWTEPRDLSSDQLASVSGGADPGGIAVLFEDSKIRRLSKRELTMLLKPDTNGGKGLAGVPGHRE